MSKQNDEVTRLRERLIEAERQYINLADTLAAGSLYSVRCQSVFM